jgi:hypothetical protein
LSARLFEYAPISVSLGGGSDYEIVHTPENFTKVTDAQDAINVIKLHGFAPSPVCEEPCFVKRLFLKRLVCAATCL